MKATSTMYCGSHFSIFFTAGQAGKTPGFAQALECGDSAM
jgi:hypothetical protein